MRSLKIVLSVFMVLAFASGAMATSVTIINSAGVSTPYANTTLSNMSQDANGNFTITLASTSSSSPVCGNGIVEQGEQCDPPNGTTCSATCQNIASQPVCGNGVLEAGEQCDPPNGTTCSATCQTIGSPSVPPSGGSINLGAAYPNTTLGSVGSLAAVNYAIKLDVATQRVAVNLLSADWTTNQDLIVSPLAQPKCSDITLRYKNGPDFWYGPAGTSNESIYMTSPTVLSAGSYVYVTVCNRSSTTGKFKIYWNLF